MKAVRIPTVIWPPATSQMPKPQTTSRPISVSSVTVGVNCDQDRKSTRLNSSHDQISYAVFCLKKKIPLSAADLPPSRTKSRTLSETADLLAYNGPSISPLPALAIAPETKLRTASP